MPAFVIAGSLSRTPERSVLWATRGVAVGVPKYALFLRDQKPLGAFAGRVWSMPSECTKSCRADAGRRQLRGAPSRWAVRASLFAGLLAVATSTQTALLAAPLGTQIAGDGGLRGTVGDARVLQHVRGPADAEADAARMLDIIRDSLNRGDLATARAQLEILSGRHPGSRAEAEAQQIIEAHRDRAAARTPVVPPVPSAPSDRPDDAGVPTDRRAATPQTIPGWSTQVRRVRALARDFTESTGDRVFFGEAGTDLGARARTVLAAQAEWLKRYPTLPVTLAAHADDRGGRTFNEDLAIRRGEAVRARLIEEGVEASRIKIVIFGKAQPVAVCSEPACAAQNRRVVTVIGELATQAPGVTVRAP